MAVRKKSRPARQREETPRNSLSVFQRWVGHGQRPLALGALAFIVTLSAVLGGWWLFSPPSSPAVAELPPPIHLSSSLSAGAASGQRVVDETQDKAPLTPPADRQPSDNSPPPEQAASTAEPSSAMGYEGHVYEEPPLPGVRITDPLITDGEMRYQPPVEIPPTVTPAPVPPAPAPKKAPKAPADAPQVAGGMPSPAWLKNAQPAPPPGSKAKIAIVIDDMGVDVKRSAQIIALRGPLTASFLTYASRLPEQTQGAKKAGHELMVHFPMEPKAKDINPGPDVLRSGMDSAEIARRLNEGLGHFDGYVGVNNHMGSKFTESAEGMREVMKALRARGVFWLDSRTSPKSVGEAMAAQAGVPHMGRHVFLDNEETVSSVMAQLGQLEKIAHKQGYAIAIGHPRDQTIAALAQWLPTMGQKGLVLVPLSTLVREHNSHID